MSWIAMDTARSCMTTKSNQHHTYFLWDNKGNCWCEPNYNGDGVFGGKNFFELCYEMNIKPTKKDDEHSIEIGYNLYFDIKDSLSDVSNSKHEPIFPNITESSQWQWQNVKPTLCPFNGLTDCYQGENMTPVPPNFMTFVQCLYSVCDKDMSILPNVDAIYHLILEQDLQISQPFIEMDKSIDFLFLMDFFPNLSKTISILHFEQDLEQIMRLTNIQLTTKDLDDNVALFCIELLYLLEPNAYDQHDYHSNKLLAHSVINICRKNNVFFIPNGNGNGNGNIQSINKYATDIDLRFLNEFYNHTHEYDDFLVILNTLKEKYNLDLVKNFAQ